MSKIIFIRHAQASYMAEDYDNLSNLGIEQSKSLGKYLDQENIYFDRVFAGPLKRHIQTFNHSSGEMLNGQIRIPIILDGLKEHNGPEALKIMYPKLSEMYSEVKEWRAEMKARPELKKRNSLRIFKLFIEDWMAENVKVDDPSVEPFSIWKEGVRNSLERIFSTIKSKETIGVFTSGGTIGAIIALALDIQDGRKIANLNDSIRNTSMSIFHRSSQGFNVLSFNEIPHLNKEQITFV